MKNPFQFYYNALTIQVKVKYYVKRKPTSVFGVDVGAGETVGIDVN